MREPLKEDIARELDLLSTRLPKEIYQNLIQRIQWTINAEIKKKYPMSDEIIEHFSLTTIRNYTILKPQNWNACHHNTIVTG